MAKRITQAHSALRSEQVGSKDYLDIPISLQDYEDILDRTRGHFARDFQRFVESILSRATAEAVLKHNGALESTFSLGMFDAHVEAVNSALYRKVYDGQPLNWWAIFDKKNYHDIVRALDQIQMGSWGGQHQYELDDGVPFDEGVPFDPVGYGVNYRT